MRGAPGRGLPGPLRLANEQLASSAGSEEKARVDPAVVPAQGHVLLDARTRPSATAATGDADAEGVVGQADRHAEGLLRAPGCSRRLAVRGRGRVGGRAGQQDQLGAAGVPGGADRGVDLAHGRHAGGDDDRLAGPRAQLADQRQVDDLRRGDLVRPARRASRAARPRSASNGLEKAEQPVLAGPLEDRLVPVPRRVRLLVELVEVAPAPEVVVRRDPERRACPTSIVIVSARVGLDLDRLGAGLGDRVDDGQRPVQRAVVVAGHLGDDQRTVIAVHRVRTDLNGGVEVHGTSVSTRASDPATARHGPIARTRHSCCPVSAVTRRYSDSHGLSEMGRAAQPDRVVSQP